MAFYTDNHAAAPSAPVFGRVTEIFADAFASVKAYAVYRKTVSELSDLSARELADLGITEDEIKQVALEASFGKRG